MACPDRAVRSARASGALGHVGGANRPEKRVFWGPFWCRDRSGAPGRPKRTQNQVIFRQRAHLSGAARPVRCAWSPGPDGPRSYVSRFCGPSWYARVREAFLVWCGRRTSRSLSATPERFKTPVNTGASQFGRHDILLPDSRVKNDVKFR